MGITPVTWPRSDGNAVPPVPKKRFFVRVGPRQIELARGEVLIGRSTSCDVVIEDMLVSRQHARMLVSRDALFIEDLGSSNGVIVNEKRAVGATLLRDGDRLIIGTYEISVREMEEEDDGKSEQTFKRPSYPTMPAPVIARTTHRATLRDPGAAASNAPSVHPGMDALESQRTDKQDSLLTMARMADRMMTMGRNDAAVRLLGDHLRGVLEKAKRGDALPRPVLEAVGVYGLKLGDVTRDAAWANLAIETHALARRPLPEKALVTLETLATRADTFDRPLLLHYKAVLRETSATFGKSEQELVERLLRIPTR